GLLGRRIEPVVQGSEATPAAFGAHLRQLLGRDRVTTVFSGGNGASRRAMVPIMEAAAALLWYPWDYEGLELSRHIFYGGGCPNQVGEAIAAWLLRSGAQRVYLLGQGDALTRTLRAILSMQLAQQGGQWAGEVQVSPTQLDFGDAIAQIDRASPDLVISTLHGASQRAFWGHYAAVGKTAGDRPILSIHLSEAELLTLGPNAAGHYAVQRYFQSLDLPENQRFVEQFQTRYGHHRPLTSAIATAYTQVHLWAQAVALAQSLDSDRVSAAAIGMTWASPLGTVALLPNRHLQQPYRIAQALPNGQFAASLTSEPLLPLPWLGLEETASPAVAIAQELLDETTQLTERVQQLEQHNRDLTSALEQMQQRNQRELTAAAQLAPDLPLLQSVAGLRSILAAMNELIVIYNPDGRCLHVLSGYRNGLQATPQTWIGQSLEVLYPPDCAQAIRQSIERTLAQQRLVELEYVFPAAEGDRWFAAQFTPISAAAVLCVTRDITEQKQAEARLQQSEERFRSIVFHAAIAIGLTDLNGNLLDCNPSALDMFGYTFEEFRGLSFTQYTHADDLSLDLALYRELIAGKRDSYQVEKRYIRKNGEIFWGRLTVCAIAGPDGQVALTFGMVENISDYKQAQDALQLSETRFRTIVDNLPGAVYRGTHSLEWEDEFMSAAIADITGYPVTEFLPLGDRTFGSIVY
ncbi:MAG TPA: transporter substrate-binding protein, partial [Chroococcidiopsis sp.]